MEGAATWQIWLAAIVTLGIYSYLLSDNKAVPPAAERDDWSGRGL